MRGGDGEAERVSNGIWRRSGGELAPDSDCERKGGGGRESERVSQRERESQSVCVCERERERERGRLGEKEISS